MNQLRELVSADRLDYDKLIDPASGEGIVPVTCVDSFRLATEGLMAFRMQGFANEEAVAMTLGIGKATFFSRERQQLWTKGEESGNFLLVRAAYTDCDADSLLLDVDAQGPSCHTGAETCFVDPDAGGEPAIAEVSAVPVDVPGYLASLATLEERAARLRVGEPPATYTQELMADQNKRVKKLGSESAELVREECRPDFDPERLLGEAADLTYAVEVMVSSRGLPFASVLNELARRNRPSP